MLSRWTRLNDEQKLLMLTTVHADADRLSRLITELLDVARLDTGRLSLARRGADVRVLLERIITNVQAGAPHDIELERTPELPEVYIDPDKFTQVVTNVVENAIRHGGGTVRVTAEPWFNEGWTTDGVRLTIDDEGDGIPLEMRRRVFTKFWTGHGARGGTGLGLYLVNGITRAHGGQVTILDAPGGGARIVMDWPGEPDYCPFALARSGVSGAAATPSFICAQSQSPDRRDRLLRSVAPRRDGRAGPAHNLHESRPRPTPDHSYAPSMGSRRVLVVEDERIINEAVADRLRAEGFEVEQAYDGPGAVERYIATRPDLVVLDVMLPGFDGLEVCRRIQAPSMSQSMSQAPVPVLMLTARDDEADILVGLAVGADDYLTKPFRMRELVARVRALLRRVERAAELASRPAARLVVGDLVVDTGARRVVAAGEEVRLTPTEFDLLARLAAAPGDVLDARAPARRRLGLGGRLRHAHGRQPREGPARKDRRRPRAHGARRRLRARGPASMSTPLAAVGSIKVKLGVLVVASVVVAMLVSLVGHDSGVPLLLAFPVTVALALGVTQLLAVGMTSPLREMTEAARRMARGDYRGRVRAESADEVGELARAFNQMATELDTVDQEQRALVATVSHELRTPLAGLTAVLENLADGVVPADEAHLEAAVGQARRLSDLVGDLLELSRVDAGVAPLRLGDVDVAGLLDETVAELVPTGRAVSFSVDVAAGLTVRADRARLRQLVVNLLDNAVRHGPDRGTVRVRATTAEARWQLEIADDGPGVPPADRERAFERFGTLATDPSSTAAGGTGLGLAIARWVAALHGGTVRFVDPPAGTTGAVLRVDLPVDPPPRVASRPVDVPLPLPIAPEVTMSETAPAPSPTSPVDVPPVIDPLFGKPLARRVRVGPAGGAGRARRRRAGGNAGPVPRPRPGVLPGAARGRWHGLVGREAPHRPVHVHLSGAGGAVHAARRAAGRRVDRWPVPAGRHGQPDRRA